jgi:hypothetical protein
MRAVVFSYFCSRRYSLPPALKRRRIWVKNLQQSQQFLVGPSHLRQQLLITTHGLAVLACWLNGLAVVYKFGLSVIVLGSWLVNAKPSKAEPIYLRYTPRQGWWLCSDGENYQPIQIKPSSVISRMLTILHYTDMGDGGGTVLIFKDAMDTNDYRRLIVSLKISGCGQDR